MDTNLKFNSAICTSRDQSERLLAFGLKKETADMVHVASYERGMVILPYNWFPFTEVDMENFIPAWSLHRLIVLSNIGIMDSSTDNIYDKVIRYIEFLIKCGDFNKEYLED